jgi:hypothetical protein
MFEREDLRNTMRKEAKNEFSGDMPAKAVRFFSNLKKSFTIPKLVRQIYTDILCGCLF